MRALLDGDSDLVRSLALEHGDLQSLKGAIPFTGSLCFEGQLCAMLQFFWYIERPDMVDKPERKKQLGGLLLPMHLERAWFRGDIFIGASPILISFLEHF